MTPLWPGPDREDLPYHRLAHRQETTARWWRPLAILGLGAALYAVLFGLWTVVFVAVEHVPGMLDASDGLDDPRNPLDQLMSLGLLALLVPSVVLAFRWAGARRGPRGGTLHSVAGHFRWGLALRASAVIVPVFVLVNWGTAIFFPLDDTSAPPFDATLVLGLLVIVVLVPLQCAGEEYAFRALPQQVLGTWIKRPVLGILLPVPAFVLGHEYSLWGQLDVALFAVCMGFLTWKTGGVEVPVVLHTANNLTLMLAALWSPLLATQGDTRPLVIMAYAGSTLVLTAWATWWTSRRSGIGLLEPVRATDQPAGHRGARHA